MRKIIALLLISLSLSTLSWAQLKSPITEQEAMTRAWSVALEQQRRNENWVDLENSGTLFDGKEWVVFLHPKANEDMGDGDFIMVYLTPEGEFVKFGLAY